MASTSSDLENPKRNFMVWKRIDTPKKTKSAEEKASSERKTSDVVPLLPQHSLAQNKYIIDSINAKKDERVTRRALNNPFVALGVAATTGCLIGMCYTSIKKDQMKTQYFMRGRVAAQFFTFCMLFGGAWYLTVSDRNTDNAVE